VGLVEHRPPRAAIRAVLVRVLIKPLPADASANVAGNSKNTALRGNGNRRSCGSASNSTGACSDHAAHRRGGRRVVDDGPKHASAVAVLRDSLAGLSPTDFLRATWREGEGPFEQRLLDVSDRSYGLIIATLQERFAPQAIGSATLAVSAMETMDEINRLLVQRGLLPHSLCRERRGHGCLRGYIGAAPRAAGFSAFSCRVLTGACPADLWPSLWTPG